MIFPDKMHLFGEVLRGLWLKKMKAF